MKYYIAFCIIFFTQSTFGKTIISGQILNYDGKSKLAYTSTVEGVYTPYWIDLYPNPNGSFKIKLHESSLGTTQIVFLAGIGLQYSFLHSGNANITNKS